MDLRRISRWAIAAAVSSASAPALADAARETADWQRNGALSRHLWSHDLARQEVFGVRITAGLALGLHASVQTRLQRNVTPALSLEVSSSSRLSVLPGGRRGTMLVLHSTR